MQNFHYKPNVQPPPRNAELYRELLEIQRDLEEKNKKLQAQKHLEEEFYEDNKNMGIADDIMNELMGNKSGSQNKPNAQLQLQPPPVARISPPYIQESRPIQPAPKAEFKMEPERPFARQQNNFISQREIQKQKLQNRNADDYYPFGRNESREKPVKRSPQPAPQRDMAPRSLEKRPQNIGGRAQENPFLKNEEMLAKKREEQQKRYRRLLEEQMEQQKRRKKQQQQNYKRQKSEAFNNYVPVKPAAEKQEFDPYPNNSNPVQRPKKRDPNGEYPVYENTQSAGPQRGDVNFMRLQVDDLKNKFKKGRINHQEYENQCKKLELHYSIKIQELEENENRGKKSAAIAQEKDDTLSRNISHSRNDPQSVPHPSEDIRYTNKSQHQHPSRSQIPENNHERRNLQNHSDYPQPQPQPQPYRMPVDVYSQPMIPGGYTPQGGYQQQQMMSQMMGNMMGSNPSEMQLQIMMKLFDEFKGIIKLQHESQMDLLNQKKLWHETISRMSPFYTQSPNPNLYTQPVPAQPIPEHREREYFSDVKKFQKNENTQPKKQVVTEINPYGDSEASNSYIEKSLSAVVSKIPLTKKQQQKQSQNFENSREAELFYEKKYKVKKFKPFKYAEPARTSSTVPIPSVSNYLESNNAKDELNMLFQQDLRRYKKLQKEKQMEMMRKKINQNKGAGSSLLGKSQLSSVSQSQNQSELRRERNKLSAENMHDESSNSIQRSGHQQVRKNSKSPNRNYRKLREGEHQKQMVNPFLKKHVSSESYQPPTFQQKDFKACDFLHSPQQKSAQILEQEQYQTEPRNYEQSSSKKQKKKEPIQALSSQNQIKNPSAKILDIMKTNNELLSKYELTPSRNSISSIKESVRVQSSKDSRDYFSSHDISPVQRKQYESSLETVRSQEESARLDRKNNMDLLMMGSAQRQQTLLSQYNSPVVTVHASPSVESIELNERKSQSNLHANNSNNRLREPPSIMGYSDTVQSVDESSSKFPSFHRPPTVAGKKVGGRSTSRKKESVVRIGGNESRTLSGIISEGSKQRSSLAKPHEEQEESQHLTSVHLDSNIYESGYEASVSMKRPIKESTLKKSPKKDNYYDFQPMVPEGSEEKQETKEPLEVKANQSYQSSLKEQNKPAAAPVHKWKSLEEARKIAKQFRQRSGEDNNRSSVEEKLSQLESFIHTNKKDESSFLKSKISQGEAAAGGQTKKKDIMKMLDELGDDEDDYRDDFDSYKEQSER